MDKKIFIAGHRGLVGGAILRELQRKGYTNFALKTRNTRDNRAFKNLLANDNNKLKNILFIKRSHV